MIQLSISASKDGSATHRRHELESSFLGLSDRFSKNIVCSLPASRRNASCFQAFADQAPIMGNRTLPTATATFLSSTVSNFPLFVDNLPRNVLGGAS